MADLKTRLSEIESSRIEPTPRTSCEDEGKGVYYSNDIIEVESSVTGFDTKAEFEAMKDVISEVKVRLLQLEAKAETQTTSDHTEEALHYTVEAEIHTHEDHNLSVSVSSMDAEVREVDSNMTVTPQPIIQLN